MPVCNKCNVSFPNVVFIHGKERFLNKRKYCLDCSPWGCHNTKKKHISDKGIVCSVCKKIYDYRKKLDSRTICYSCKVNERRYKVKQRCVNYKGGKCAVCDYNRCLQALQFHHVNPKEKDFQISGKHCLSWEKIKKELDKCVLLCNRCHAELHAGLIELPR
jgi:hypothetical protein